MTPFAIIKYYNFAFGEKRAVYEKIVSPERESATLSKQDAMKMIAEYGMERVIQNEHGSVWEMEGHPFFDIWKNHYGDAEARRLEAQRQGEARLREYTERIKRMKIERHKAKRNK